MADKTKMFKDQIKEIRVDIHSIDRGEAPESGRAALLKLLDEKKSKLKELEMSDKTAKGVDTKDINTLKNVEKDELKTRTEKYEKALEEADNKPTFDIKKKLPKSASLAKKLNALKILKAAGFGKTATDLPAAIKKAGDSVLMTEATLKELHSVLAASNVDDQDVIDMQRTIEELLVAIEQWKTNQQWKVHYSATPTEVRQPA
jgi:hypothetical protein